MSTPYDQDRFKPLPSGWWDQEFPEPPRLVAASTTPESMPVWSTLGRRLLLLFAWPVSLLFDGLLAGALGVCALYLWIAPGLPGEVALASVHLQQPLRIYSADGLLIGEFGTERRQPLSYAETPPLLIKAFLAAEDSRFFEHPGIDPQGLLRAVLSLVRTGERSQGGSTITMQLVRNLFLTPEKSFRRKLSELALALRLEAHFSKEQIFELYQNRIFFGHHAYGVAAAARVYYGKEVGALSLAQMATLAGIPQAPSIHNPVTRPRRALARRAYVLERMLALGWITQQQYDEATATPDDAHLSPPALELKAPYLAEMVRQELFGRYGQALYTSGLHVTTTVDAHLQRVARTAVTTALLDYDRRHGYRGAEAHYSPATSRETLDDLLADHPPVQGLEAAVVTQVEADTVRLYLGEGQEADLTNAGTAWARPPKRRKGRQKLAALLQPGDLIRVTRGVEGQLQLAQIPVVEGALIALSPTDGAIKALVGGFDFERSQFNRAVDAQRQPGSSFKPFVYATALARGWTPASLVDDSPLEVRNGGRIWRPKNFDGKFLGPIRLREALARSRNLAAVHLLRSLGVDEARTFIASRFDFRPEQIPKGLSLVLGSGEVAPVQMAGAYARFANGGFRVTPYLIAQIRDPEGHILYQATPPLACPDCDAPPPTDAQTPALVLPIPTERSQRVLEARTAYLMRSLLEEVIRTGTGKRALALKRTDLAGKTGTSNDVRDSWFCGFQSNLVTVAWMGFDDFSPLGRGEVGGRAALGMWMGFMGEALAGQPELHPREPAGLLHVQIDRYSGTLVAAGDPDAVEEVIPQEYELMLLGPESPPLPSDLNAGARPFEQDVEQDVEQEEKAWRPVPRVKPDRSQRSYPPPALFWTPRRYHSPPADQDYPQDLL